MPTQFDADGFADIRTYLQNNWTHVAVVDDTDTEQLRWDIAANSNTSWSSGPSSNPLEATLTVTGQDIQDAGGTLPVTLSSTESYKSSSATERMAADSYTNATLEALADEVVITHQLSTPP